MFIDGARHSCANRAANFAANECADFSANRKVRRQRSSGRARNFINNNATRNANN